MFFTCNHSLLVVYFEFRIFQIFFFKFISNFVVYCVGNRTPVALIHYDQNRRAHVVVYSCVEKEMEPLQIICHIW